jgi:valyl-tRNA synthetase
MDKTYNPKAVEEKWLRQWLESGAFHGEAGRGGDPYCVVIPPPNVTGILHMGHALNNTIQDVLVRWRRMQGRNTVWMPGTDHAGIATQNVVEKALAKERKTRQDLGRDAFVQRVWKWREQYGSTIVNQLKRLGASCDWSRERFTMDEGLSDAVAEVFVRLYEKGLIYRANYIINWCPRCHTALSDEESVHQDTKGKLYYLRYPIETRNSERGTRNADGSDPRHPTDNRQPTTGNSFVVVATTRPETLLGDTAVALNPKDARYANLGRGCRILLPVLHRELAVIRDDFVDPKFGTGIVKVTPAHDANDFAMGQRHGLTAINVMNGDGTMNEEAGPYAGMDRFECRTKILADLEKAGLVEKIEDHDHAVGHCYRCDTVVEPRLSLQWFVKMKPLAAPAIEAVKSGQVQFVPERWTKVYLDWMENIRDWCISRQIWWGHRVPVFYCNRCDHVRAAKGQPKTCPKCGASDIRQDEDVLDTWFSSWLWPFSTFGWPEKNEDLAFYYPTNDLVTASEIIFFWVARMIMAGCEFMGQPPFRRVYIHGTVRDDVGRKMSKSLGNSIDPLTIIEQYSADALRFSLIQITATGQDVFLSSDKFEIGRNFGTKIWNAARYMQMQKEAIENTDATKAPRHEDGKGRMEGPMTSPATPAPEDQHILKRLERTVAECTQHLEQYRFNDYALTICDFVWHQYCDWYVEHSKHVFQDADEVRKRLTLKVMDHVFENALCLLHPLMPFLTEELWHEMGYGADRETIMKAAWPGMGGVYGVMRGEFLAIEAEVDVYVEKKHEMIRQARALRMDYGIPLAKEMDCLIRPDTEYIATLLQRDMRSLMAFLKAGKVTVDLALPPPKGAASAVTPLGTIYLPMKGLVDVEAETRRITGEIGKADHYLRGVEAKLANAKFVENAPAEVVEQQRAKRNEVLEKKEKLVRVLESLRGLQ